MIARNHPVITVAIALVCGFGGLTSPRAETVRELQNELASVLAHPALRDASVGFEARFAGGEVIMSVNADRAFLPASNMKLVTVATAFELLGGDHQCNVALAARDGERSLTSVARRIFKPSDNHLAELLLKYLPLATGREELSPEALAGEVWADRGLVVGGMCWRDGSGLSRRDLMTPAFTVRLLDWMNAESRWRVQFMEALPIAGVDGTLRGRMKDTPARGRVRAKTGTLTGVSALSGYALTRDGEPIVFSIMMNDFTCDISRMRRLQDQICAVLAGWSRSEE
jgi:D-alanyl-D-alanine carboxypeptidase